MANLAQARSKALQKARSAQPVQDCLDTLSQIRAEGYEDYSYGKTLACPYIEKEYDAYVEGWRQAHLEMTGIK